MAHPNILYLHSHDTGRYVQPYGHAIATPNIQRLAERGILFRQAFCANPTCSASRASLLTGQWPHSSGMTGLAHRGWKLNDYSHHVVNTLGEAGYESTLCGTQHVANRKQAGAAQMIGYNRELEVTFSKDNSAGLTHGDAVAAAAADFLQSAPQEPFFLSVGFTETHRNFPEPEQPADERYCLPPAPLPDTPEMRKDMAAFKTIAARLDRAMGRVLDTLESTGLADNTLVVCTTDHGIAFPHMKCNLTDHGIGVMLIMAGPGGFGGGKVVDALVSHVDVLPTLCELLEIEPPSWLDGTSFLPVVRGQVEQVREQLFAEVSYHACYEPMRCVRTARYKYIRRFDQRDRVILPNCDDSDSKTLLMEAGWSEQPRPKEMLFDLVFDPGETNNLVGQPHAQEALEEMRGRLDAHLRETDDPLLHGAVPLPPGAVLNTVDQISPHEPTVTRQP